jgi:hypothetical protein
MKSYRLYFAKPLLIYFFVPFAALVLGGIIATVALAVTTSSGRDQPPWQAVAVIPAMGAFAGYFYLRIPFEIRIHDDHMIEFRSLFRRTRLAPGEIVSVKARRWTLGYIDVRHARGTVHLVSQIGGFHDFLSTLKTLNPGVVIKGC